MTSLLKQDKFEPIFSPFKNKKIGFVVLFGNVGDWLIEEAACQLFLKFGIDFEFVNNRINPFDFKQDVCQKVDEFVVNGGGNMGGLYLRVKEIREKLFFYKKPITILPQTFNSKEDFDYKKVWIRDRKSFVFRPDAELAPDLSLGYVFDKNIPEPLFDLGIWMRQDIERTFLLHKDSLGDPAVICKTPEEYIILASKYKKIVTDRLHFAVAGLIAKREVILLPNSYFKNYYVYDAWLKNLGCQWNPFWQEK